MDDLIHDSFPSATWGHDGSDALDESRSILDPAAQHHADAKYSNTRVGNNQVRTRGNMSTIGKARALYNQSDVKAP